MLNTCDSHMAVCFLMQLSDGSVFFDLRNEQKRTTKSDTSGHYLEPAAEQAGQYRAACPYIGLLTTAWRGMGAKARQGQ